MIYRFLIICTDRAYKNAKETLVIGEFAQGFNYLRRRNLIKNRGEFFISVFVLSKSNAVRLGSDSLAAARSHSGSDSRPRLSFTTEPARIPIAKQKSTQWVLFCFGGKIGIRTLVGVLAQTRFPVVRLRPAQPSFHRVVFYHKILIKSRGIFAFRRKNK